MNAAQLLVKALESEGVEYVFGLPGEENLAFLSALRESRQIRTILVRHEQAAGFMAGAYSRLADRPGVAYSTLGAGATNLATPAGQALLGGHPVLFITGQKALRENRQGLYQRLAVTDVMRPLTKSARTIESGSQVASSTRHAFDAMREGRPGPAHLELPEDVAEDPTDGVVAQRADPPTVAASEADLDVVAKLVANAESPLVMLGFAAQRRGVPSAVRRFLDATGFPFFCTYMGKGVGDERSTRFVGSSTLPDQDYVGGAAIKADVILNVGHDVYEKAPFLMSKNDRRKVVHINTCTAHRHDIYSPQYELVGDIAASMEGLRRRLDGVEGFDHTFALSMAISMRASLERTSTRAGDRLARPQYVAAQVRQALTDDAIVTLDNGVHKLWFTRNLPVFTPRTHIVDSALGSMGPALPAAIAAALVHPARQVLAVAGDGGFVMNAQELETAVRLGLNLVALVLNDDGFGMIRMKQVAGGQPPFQVDFGNPDFCALAEAYGAHGHRLEEPRDFPEVLENAFRRGGVHVIEVPIDYSENEGLLEEMKTAVAGL